MFLLGITLPDTVPSWISVAVASIPLLLIIGGWMLARESRNKLHIEVIASALLVAATVIPSGVFSLTLMSQLLLNTVQRAPLIMVLVGMAWVADRGFKAVPGVLFVLVGLFLLYGASHL